MITLEARDYDEALDAIDIDEAIEEAILKRNSTIDIEWGTCKPFMCRGNEDCEWIPYGEASIELEDLGIGIDELLCYISDLV